MAFKDGDRVKWRDPPPRGPYRHGTVKGTPQGGIAYVKPDDDPVGGPVGVPVGDLEAE